MDTLSQLRSGMLAGARRLDLSCGLTEFPREIFDLEDSLEVLNLTGNHLRELPSDLGRLTKMRILFCSQNDFTHLPGVIGDCPGLKMVGFKANRIRTADPEAFPASLRWLILTDNQLSELPASLGKCTSLQKLMLSGNRLTQLPAELAACESLEMLRVSANELVELPDWLLTMPKLTWLAFAGNPCARLPQPDQLNPVSWDDLEVGQQIGAGASGDIFKATHRNLGELAVKMFKGEMTSDGLPEWEMSACIQAGAHPHLIPILGEIINHPDNVKGLAMTLIDPSYKTLAGPPDFDTCTRDVYPPDFKLPANIAMAIAKGMIAAADHLHERGLTHGDFYAHNILWRPDGHCYLGDFGGATSLPEHTRQQLVAIETRAVGVLLEELAHLSGDAQLQAVAIDCMNVNPSLRPALRSVLERLNAKQ